MNWIMRLLVSTLLSGVVLALVVSNSGAVTPIKRTYVLAFLMAFWVPAQFFSQYADCSRCWKLLLLSACVLAGTIYLDYTLAHLVCKHDFLMATALYPVAWGAFYLLMVIYTCLVPAATKGWRILMGQR